jgi:hypothetical protein
MGTALASLGPLILGAAIDPVWIIVALFLLRGDGGMVRGAAFASGAMGVRVLQGMLFGYVFASAADAQDENGAGIMASTLLLTVGILLLITAAKRWRKEDDPDAPPPKWMATLSAVPPFRAFTMGGLLMALAIKQWFFTLSAIAVIDGAQLGPTRSLLASLLFVVAAQSPVLVAVGVCAVAPIWFAALRDAAQEWLERNGRAITIAASSMFGIVFLRQGISGLLG